MANRDAREELRGVEEDIFDVLAAVSTSEQWAGLLKGPLEHAARQGNRSLAQKLVGAGAEMGHALHAASQDGHGEIVNDLLENGASVDAKDSSGNTPLHLVAREGKTEMVQLLLLKRADKDALDDNGFTPLFLAAQHDHEASALALMAAGADVGLRYDTSKASVLHMSALRGHVDIVRTAIERGADVDAGDRNGWTPLHFAALCSKVVAIDVLVEAGAKIQARDGVGYTPLHYAAYRVSVKAVLALLKHGADANARNNPQQTPLHLASTKAGQQRAAELVDSLLRAGADETILDGQGEAAADMIGRCVEEEGQLAEDVDRVRQLLANAPADRAWRRRGYLVLCRAHPDRVQQIGGISSAHAGMVRGTRSSAKLGRTDTGSRTGTAGDGITNGRSGGNWAVLVARMLELQEEGIFRSIVGYL